MLLDVCLLASRVMVAGQMGEWGRGQAKEEGSLNDRPWRDDVDSPASNFAVHTPPPPDREVFSFDPIGQRIKF